MIHRVNKRNQRGDTIVEVLICIIVISTVLAGAFTVSNRSLQVVRDSNERAQAVKIAESQIEELRATQIPSTTTYAGFCNDYSGGASSVINTTKASTTCYFNKSGLLATPGDLTGAVQATEGPIKDLYSSGKGVLYKVVVRSESGATPEAEKTTKFTVQISWITTQSRLGTVTTHYRTGIL